MASYLYLCEKCDKEHTIIKSMYDSARVEQCPDCQVQLLRVYTAPHIVGASVQEAEYNPGLGMVVKNKRHREEVARQRGLIEVGNETPKTLHRESVIKREQEREKEWDKI